MQSPRLHWRGQFPRGAVAPGQQWLAVCMAVTLVSRQDIPRLPWPVSVLWQWALEKRVGLGEQCPDTVGAGGLLPHCVSLGERPLPCTPPGDTVYLT